MSKIQLENNFVNPIGGTDIKKVYTDDFFEYLSNRDWYLDTVEKDLNAVYSNISPDYHYDPIPSLNEDCDLLNAINKRNFELANKYQSLSWKDAKTLKSLRKNIDASGYKELEERLSKYHEEINRGREEIDSLDVSIENLEYELSLPAKKFEESYKLMDREKNQFRFILCGVVTAIAVFLAIIFVPQAVGHLFWLIPILFFAGVGFICYGLAFIADRMQLKEERAKYQASLPNKADMQKRLTSLKQQKEWAEKRRESSKNYRKDYVHSNEGEIKKYLSAVDCYFNEGRDLAGKAEALAASDKEETLKMFPGELYLCSNSQVIRECMDVIYERRATDIASARNIIEDNRYREEEARISEEHRREETRAREAFEREERHRQQEMQRMAFEAERERREAEQHAEFLRREEEARLNKERERAARMKESAERRAQAERESAQKREAQRRCQRCIHVGKCSMIGMINCAAFRPK